MELLDSMFDSRSKSYSLIAKMKVSEYLEYVRNAYERKGGLGGQRDALKTTSALRIRRRMADDFSKGAILPPVVVGLLVDEEEIKEINSADAWANRLEAILRRDPERISIIDGMQRTTIFLDNVSSLGNNEIRVEFWIASETNSLTYRMLVLNTGQIPWNLRRQIEVVYAPMLTEIKNDLARNYPELDSKVQLFGIDDNRRRADVGQFQANDVIEMYICFGLRKAKVDTESVLADEFSRLDMIDAVSKPRFLGFFLDVFVCLCKLDLAFGRYKGDGAKERFSIGRHLFDSQPACVGFVTAAAQKIYGRIGADRASDQQEDSLKFIVERCNKVAEKFEQFNEDEAREFLSFDILNDRLNNVTAKRIGDFEREYFTEAFRLFFTEDHEVNNLLACWRAF